MKPDKKIDGVKKIDEMSQCCMKSIGRIDHVPGIEIYKAEQINNSHRIVCKINATTLVISCIDSQKNDKVFK